MEGFAVLIVLAALFCVFVLPIVASIKAASALRRVEQLAARLADTEIRLAQLAAKFREAQGRTLVPSVAMPDDLPAQEERAPASGQAPVPPRPQVAPPPIPGSLPAHDNPDWQERVERARAMARSREGRTHRDQDETATDAPPHQEAPPPPPVQEKPGKPAISLEQFMGVKMFAWLGGIALFFGVIFFVKYAFERNLIPPAVRVAMGFVAGAGLLAGGLATHRKQAYQVLAQAFCATGVLILYGVSYSAHAVYHFPAFGPWVTFSLMGLITVAAILVAVRLEAPVVAVLGMVGGFLAPLMFPGVRDNTFALFSYIALLDIGLLAVTGKGRWPALAAGAAAGTLLMQWRWFDEFFHAGRYFEGNLLFVPMGLALGFITLFIAATWWMKKSGQDDARGFAAGSTLALSALAMAFAFHCLFYPGIACRTFVLYGFVLALNTAVVLTVLAEPRLAVAHWHMAVATFIHLFVWTVWRLKPDWLGGALAVYLVFGALHAVLPVVWQRRGRAGIPPIALPAAPWIPLLPLVLVLAALVSLPQSSWLIWPAVLLVDFLAVALAALTGTLLAVPVALVLTLLVTGAWLLGEPVEAAPLGTLLGMIVVFAGIFAAAGLWLARRAAADGKIAGSGDAMAASILPACSGAMPFALLVMAIVRLPLANPSPVFGVAALLAALLLGLAVLGKQTALPLVALACTLAVENVWHAGRWNPSAPWTGLAWYLGFYLAFTAFPFLFHRRLGGRMAPWAAGALSGPGHFLLVHDVARRAFPNQMMGLLPLAFAVPALLGLAALLRLMPADAPGRPGRLAWFGGVALLFITLVFPIQFDRQWITVGWALEGAALVWLYRRVPHPGLKFTGLALLAVSFARLAINPAVFEAYPRDGTPILNWHLYAYGIVALTMLAGGLLLPEKDRRLFSLDVPPVLFTFCGILLFLLLNIEIADYFTEPGRRFIAFRFGGNFARDMTYSIAWGLFSLCLLVLGITLRAKGARYAAIGLLAATLLKLFTHDLSAIDSIYRIGALIGVAFIAFIASFLYQRFFAMANKQE